MYSVQKFFTWENKQSTILLLFRKFLQAIFPQAVTSFGQLNLPADNRLLTWPNTWLLKNICTYQEPYLTVSINFKLVCHNLCPNEITILLWRPEIIYFILDLQNPMNILPRYTLLRQCTDSLIAVAPVNFMFICLTEYSVTLLMVLVVDTCFIGLTTFSYFIPSQNGFAVFTT